MSVIGTPISSMTRLFSLGQDGAVARNALRKAMKTSPKRAPNAPTATLTTQDRGRVGVPNVSLFRNWAEHSEWCRAALNIRRDQVANADWVIDAEDHKKPWSRTAAEEITALLMEPNPVDESWETFIQTVVEDLLVLDAGVIEKERTLRGGLAYLHSVDGATIRVYKYWDGDPDEPRYYWYPDYQERASFKNSDLIYMRANPMTYRVVGLAPFETLRAVVDAELSGQSYNTRQIKAPAPDGILDLGEQARPDQVEAFKMYWNAEVAGKGAMAFLGGTKGAQFMQFRNSNRDMQFLEYQMYLARKIAAVMGMSMMDLGIPVDTNRATASVTSENTDDRGLRPLLGLVASYMTRGVVRDTAFGGNGNNLVFKFTSLNLKESMSRAQRNRHSLGGMPWMVIDEARREDGYPPIGGTLGSSLLVMGSKGPVLLTEGEIPTAREALEQGSKPAPGGGSSTSDTLPAVMLGDSMETDTWSLD
jgi:HK97 family phage portal protein